MTTLFLDFGSNKKSAAIVSTDRTLASIMVDDHTQEESLMSSLEKMAVDGGMKLSGIERVAVVTGPGGFMSLRVGLSIGNTIAWARALSIGGIHLSELYAARTRNTKDCVWAHSTKKQELFIRGFGRFGELFPDPVLKKIDEVATLVPPSTPFMGELIPEQESILKLKKIDDLLPLDKVLPSVINSTSFTKPPITPWYGRGY